MNLPISNTEQRAVVDRRGPGHTLDADQTVRKFACWLAEIGTADGLARRNLILLFDEFCLHELAADGKLLTEHQLLRRVRAAGIERYRLTTGRREWLYRLRTAAVIGLGERKGAA